MNIKMNKFITLIGLLLICSFSINGQNVERYKEHHDKGRLLILDGSNKKHVILPLPPESPRHKGKFIVERHPGDPRRELICWEPRKAKHMTPLEAAATVLQRMSEAARSEKSMDLKAVFQKYDADGGGSIDQEELGLVLKEFHILLDEEELSEVFSIFDPDGGGEISYLEFVYAIFNI